MGQSQSGQEAVCFRANRGAAKVFGRRSRSGADEIRAEQTDINTSPQRHARTRTSMHTHTHTDTDTRRKIFTENKRQGNKVCRGRTEWVEKKVGRKRRHPEPLPPPQL